MTVATAPEPEVAEKATNSIEAWLDSHGLSYTQKVIRLDQVDKTASLRNQARIGAPLNDDQVLMYGAAMENGDEFPPLVVYQQPEGRKYVVIDGNHRVAAHELAGHDSAPAYVVDRPSTAQTILLTFEANTKHGLPTGMEERLRQAVMLAEHGATLTSAAQRLGVPLKRVQDAVHVRKTDRRADTIGLPGRWYDLTAGVRRRLGSLRNDNTFKAAAELAMVTKMPGIDVERLVRDLNQTRTETEATDLIKKRFDEQKDVIKVTAGGRLGLSPRLAQWNAATRKITHIQVSDFRKVQMGSDLKSRMRLNTIQAMNRMSEILEVLK